MKLFICIIMLLLTVSVAGPKTRIRRHFSDIMSIDSIMGSDDIIIERIDFDYLEVYNEFCNKFISHEGFLKFSEIRVKYESGDSLSDFEKECIALGEEQAILNKLLPIELNWSLSAPYFDIFANKPYFDNSSDILKTEFDMVRSGRVDSMVNIITHIVSSEASVTFRNYVDESNDDKYYSLPVSLFLARNGNEYCWIFIKSWEYKSASINILDSSPSDIANVGHIEGTVFNFDFSESLISFACM